MLEFILFILVGFLLGVFGGGGSILLFPILVFFYNLEPLIASSYTLFLIGITSLLGAYFYFMKKEICIRCFVTFGLISTLTTILVRFFLPIFPQNLFGVITLNSFILIIFSFLMFLTGLNLFFRKKELNLQNESNLNNFFNKKLIFYSFLVGLLTGLTGAGAGFLIVPALLLSTNINFKTAVGTSLLIIGSNSIFGFLTDINNFIFNWRNLFLFLFLIIIGLVIGLFLSNKLNIEKLKKSFALILLFLSLFFPFIYFFF